MRVPSGLNAALDTASSWPLSGSPIGWPLAASQIRAVLSSDAVTMRCAVGAERRAHTPYPHGPERAARQIAPGAIELQLRLGDIRSITPAAASGSASSASRTVARRRHSARSRAARSARNRDCVVCAWLRLASGVRGAPLGSGARYVGKPRRPVPSNIAKPPPPPRTGHHQAGERDLRGALARISNALLIR